MDSEHNPVFGRTQPDNGVYLPLRFPSVGRPKTNPVPKGDLEAEIGAKISDWMRRSLSRRYKNETDQMEALNKRCGVGVNTIREIIRGTRSARVDTLKRIADELGHDISELFQPPQEPQEGQPDSASAGPLQRRSG